MMEWFDALFGNDSNDNAPAGKRGQGDIPSERDPYGRVLPEPVFDAFRSAWKAGLGLFDLFGKDPVRIKEPVGSKAPNRRPDVAKVETFLDRTGQLDLITTDGPTGYYGSRVDQGIRRFQKDNALKVDGLINPNGPTIQLCRVAPASEQRLRKSGGAWFLSVWREASIRNDCR